MEINFDNFGKCLLNGDSREVLKSIPDDTVDCCITSPPYFNLRDYGADGQIGMENTPDEYIRKLVDVFHEVKRVLKQEGTLWVNIGDSYCNSNGYERMPKEYLRKSRDNAKANDRNVSDLIKCGYKIKDKIGIPWMLAFALRQDGWYLRQDIIWCLSESTHVYAMFDNGLVASPMLSQLYNMFQTGEQFTLWNGEKWVHVTGIHESNLYNDRIKIVLKDGECLECTDGHKWILENGMEVTASELKQGDKLKKCVLPDANGSCEEDRTLLYELGKCIGSGIEVVEENGSIAILIRANNVFPIETLYNELNDIGIESVLYHSDNNTYIKIISGSFADLCAKCIDVNLNGVFLSLHLMNMNNHCLKHIINGYLNVCGLSCHDDEICIHNIPKEHIPFLRIVSARLNASVELHEQDGFYEGKWNWSRETDWNEIVSIEHGTSDKFYDVTVDSEDHAFALSSGILTHNCKPNPMPESVRDRCTGAHEYIFLLSKSPQYYFDYEAIQEPANYDGRKDLMMHGGEKYSREGILAEGKPQTMACRGHERWKFKKEAEVCGDVSNANALDTQEGKLYAVRNKRDVWTVATKSYNGAHFATYPKELIEPCVLAGCPKEGIVLDPFNGAGTTGIVAVKNNRKYIGIDLKMDYIKLTEQRFYEDDDSMQINLF